MLASEIYDYTHQVLSDLASEGLLPEFVQVGNETNGNILSGSNPYPVDWPRQSTLFNSAISAVRDIDTANNRYTKIVLHIADPSQANYWFGEAENNGITDYDVIGLSYYPQYHGSNLPQVGTTIESLRNAHKKNVMLVEVAVPWTTAFNDGANNILNSLPSGYGGAPSIAGQRDWLVDTVEEVHDHNGIGVIYWEPGWVSTGCATEFGVGSHWENATFFDFGNNLILDGGVQFLEQAIAPVINYVAGVPTNGGQWGTGITGQAFTPKENAVPNPGYPGFVYLLEMSFTQGGNTGGSIGTRLDIYRPTGSTLATSELIGSSINTVDTNAMVDTVYTFQFDGLELLFNSTYLAIFKDDAGNPLALGLLQGWEGSTSVEEYLEGGAIFNYDSNGWTEDTNVDFSATLSTVEAVLLEVNVPALSWIYLSVLLTMFSAVFLYRKKL